MLRPYQKEALARMTWFANSNLDAGGVVVLPTGSGKSHLISAFASTVKEPILILAPNKEILEQNISKLSSTEIGVFSASMGSKTVDKYTFGTIQSVYKHPDKFKHFKYVLVDECHLVHPNRETMYAKLFREMNAKIIGLTATPYRLDGYYKRWGDKRWQVDRITTIKMLTRYRNGLFRYMLYVANAVDLKDYLSFPEYKEIELVNRSFFKVNKQFSDYDLEYFEYLVKPKLEKIAFMINNADVNSIIVYCPSIDFANALKPLIHNSAVVTSKTPRKNRNEAIEGLRNGSLRVILNVSVLTLGFDYMDLESIFLLRPTRSLTLHMQMIGRLTRPSSHKKVVYDLVGNIADLGKIENIQVKKVDNKWNVTSDAYPTGFHMEPIYKFRKKEDDYVF